jgi:hypothetical protein
MQKAANYLAHRREREREIERGRERTREKEVERERERERKRERREKIDRSTHLMTMPFPSVGSKANIVLGIYFPSRVTRSPACLPACLPA